MKEGSNKEVRMEEEINTDSQKGDNLKVLVEMWDRRAWEYEIERDSGALNVLWESMLIWWRPNLTKSFSDVLRQSSGTWKRVGLSQGIREVVGKYVWIEGASFFISKG